MLCSLCVPLLWCFFEVSEVEFGAWPAHGHLFSIPNRALYVWFIIIWITHFILVSILSSFLQMLGESKSSFLFYLLVDVVYSKAVIPDVFCFVVSVIKLGTHQGPFVTLILCYCSSYHLTRGQPSCRLSHDQLVLAFQNQINLWGKSSKENLLGIFCGSISINWLLVCPEDWLVDLLCDVFIFEHGLVGTGYIWSDLGLQTNHSENSLSPCPHSSRLIHFLAYLCRPSCSPDDRPNKTSLICMPIAGAMCG